MTHCAMDRETRFLIGRIHYWRRGWNCVRRAFPFGGGFSHEVEGLRPFTFFVLVDLASEIAVAQNEGSRPWGGFVSGGEGGIARGALSLVGEASV